LGTFYLITAQPQKARVYFEKALQSKLNLTTADKALKQMNQSKR
jgi:hypothetical protein